VDFERFSTSVVGFDCGDEFNISRTGLILAMEPSEE